MTNLEFYTDGAFSFARGTGGVGIVVLKNGEKVYTFSKTYKDTTNNRCELLAVIHSLNSVSKPVDSIIIHTDSQYVIGGATKGWKRNKNVDLWKLYDHYYDKVSKLCPDIKFVWVKGHQKTSGLEEEMNNLADKLAQLASTVI